MEGNKLQQYEFQRGGSAIALEIRRVRACSRRPVAQEAKRRTEVSPSVRGVRDGKSHSGSYARAVESGVISVCR